MDPAEARTRARASLYRAGAFLLASCFAFVTAAVHIDSHSRATWPLIAAFGLVAGLQLYYSVVGIVSGVRAKGSRTRSVAPIFGVLGALVALAMGGMGLVMLVLKATGRGGHGWGGA